tara:strand:- start:2774 stop:3523 length:750 start_codon:yes stop_codon:yes gene_type:complete
MITPAETTPRATEGKGGTDVFDTIWPGGGAEKNTLEWQQGLRRAFLRGKSYFQHYMNRGGVPKDQQDWLVNQLYTGKPVDRRFYSARAKYGGYYGHKARWDYAQRQKNAQKPQQTRAQQPRAQRPRPGSGQGFGGSPQTQMPMGRVEPFIPAWSRHVTPNLQAQARGPGFGPRPSEAYQTGNNFFPLGGTSYGPNVGPGGRVDPNTGIRYGAQHHNRFGIGGYGPGGRKNPNAMPGFRRKGGSKWRGYY